HKHLPEMQACVGLRHPPLFCPAVVPAHRGMVVEVPLALGQMTRAAPVDALRSCLADFYAGSAVVRVCEDHPEELLLRRSMQATDRLDLHVFGSRDGSQARLMAVLDKLGKGAGGAAVQNLNLMAGLPETAGLRL
ncbi:MAG: N-acetyl-gamma-glutamyl-phosphate reductase, partial [Alteraurantiacibacter sp.]|nr:N-acetyl-gamma-glutamyl-phosphate reductase [Alteraurantiacibacter sp.]